MDARFAEYRRTIAVAAALVAVAVTAVVSTVLLRSPSEATLPTGPVSPGPASPGPVSPGPVSPRTDAASPGPRELSLLGNARAVAADGNGVWYLGDDRPGARYVAQIDPVTGQEIRRVSLVGEDGPYGIAFAHGSAWVTLSVANKVMRLTPDGPRVSEQFIPVPGHPTDIVATESGDIWVRQSSENKLSRMGPTSTSGRVETTVNWAGPLLGPAGGASVWTTDGSRLVELEPGSLPQGASVSAGMRIQLNKPPVAAVTTRDGLWAASNVTAYWYSAASLRSGNPELDDSADAPHFEISALARAGDGVVILASPNLYYWNPRG